MKNAIEWVAKNVVKAIITLIVGIIVVCAFVVMAVIFYFSARPAP